MDFIFKPECYYRLNVYLKKLSFYAYIIKPEVYKKIHDIIQAFDVVTQTKTETKVLVKNYLYRLSSYTDINYVEVNRIIQTTMIDPLIVPL